MLGANAVLLIGMKTVTLVCGVILTTLTYRAYRRTEAPAMRALCLGIGFVTLGGVGVVNALFWLLDPTSIELHFQTHGGPATLVKGYAIVVLTGLVVAGLCVGFSLFCVSLLVFFFGQVAVSLGHTHPSLRSNRK